MTRTNALATLGIVLAASVAACSYLVDADRSKVSDTLYQPTPMEAGPEGSMALVIFADSVPPLEATFVKRSGSDDEPQTNYYQHARVPGQ